MLAYLMGSVCQELAMAVHQCARFSIDPKRSHEQVVMCIGKYLIGTKDKGIIYTPDPTLGLDVYVDTDFAGGRWIGMKKVHKDNQSCIDMANNPKFSQ